MKRPPLPLLVVVALLVGSREGATIDILPDAATVAERVAAFDIVLRVRAASAPSVRAEDSAPAIRKANPELELREPMLSPVIEQDVEVLEVLRGRSSATEGAIIRVETSGGHNGMHLNDDWRRRALVPQGEYILLLSVHPTSRQLRFLPFDMFRLDGPVVTVPFETAYGRTLLGMTPSEALVFIRGAVATSRR